jgi:hypothetical protein
MGKLHGGEMKKKADVVRALRDIKATPRKRGDRVLTFDEGRAVIRAYRRGVHTSDIAHTLGTSRTNIYAKIGAWALRHADIG